MCFAVIIHIWFSQEVLHLDKLSYMNWFWQAIKSLAMKFLCHLISDFYCFVHLVLTIKVVLNLVNGIQYIYFTKKSYEFEVFLLGKPFSRLQIAAGSGGGIGEGWCRDEVWKKGHGQARILTYQHGINNWTK